jgi:methylmalonyl-CoA mutase C-terminal domain/subunit
MHRPRILLTKIGLDGHDRGSRIVATYLRDAGMEVIYTGPWQSVANVVKTAVEEDVDVIGISTLSNDYVLIPELMDALKSAESESIPVVVGGIVPPEEERTLLDIGVKQVLHPGATRTEIVSAVSRLTGAVAEEG